jgi:hypothetical protein
LRRNAGEIAKSVGVEVGSSHISCVTRLTKPSGGQGRGASFTATTAAPASGDLFAVASENGAAEIGLPHDVVGRLIDRIVERRSQREFVALENAAHFVERHAARKTYLATTLSSGADPLSSLDSRSGVEERRGEHQREQTNDRDGAQGLGWRDFV